MSAPWLRWSHSRDLYIKSSGDGVGKGHLEEASVYTSYLDIICFCGVMRGPRTQCITPACPKCTWEGVCLIDDQDPQGYIVCVILERLMGKGILSEGKCARGFKQKRGNRRCSVMDFGGTANGRITDGKIMLRSTDAR